MYQRQLTPSEFAAKWAGSWRTERAAAQEHFIDLCRMLEVATPNEADPIGDWYAFEKGADKVAGGDGFADVWKRDHFAWEYKGKKKDLDAAYQQLLQYREALENPPLLVVCDLNRFEVHTNFTGTAKVVHKFALNTLATTPQEPLRILRAVMGAPYSLRPSVTTAELTEDAAQRFAELASVLRSRGHQAQAVAHFLNKLVFCMFAEDAGLLPRGLISQLADHLKSDPAAFSEGLSDLFGKMSVAGGLFGAEKIQWFNGGLFDGAEVLPLQSSELAMLREVSQLDWSQIEPAIFGTLFERGLDPDKRTQLGAHYTDRASITSLVEPVVIGPLRAEFEVMKTRVVELLAAGKKVTKRTPDSENAEKVFHAYLERLRSIRVLDPACGSGNFLYLALQALKDLEREAILWGSLTLQKPQEFPQVGPHAVHGIEVSIFAAELARVTIWIGEIQWMLNNGFAYLTNPILQPLNSIECRDALLDLSDPGQPKEAKWPAADAIVGNPPFLGGKLLRTSLGSDYVDTLLKVFNGRVPAEADLVCYWFEKARALVSEGNVKRVGLLATQGIRGGANRRVLERIEGSGRIFMARSDEPWVLDGAAVHVSFVCFDGTAQGAAVLDGVQVASINANLTSGLDLTKARRLKENMGIAFMGDTKGGPFDIPHELAEQLLLAPNPDGRSNRDVVRPWVNGFDITSRSRDMWIIDFGLDMSIEEAALYEAPFSYVEEHVQPTRVANRRAAYAERWWLHVEPRSGMRARLAGLDRYIATPRVTKHRLFAWLPAAVLADSATIVLARDDDYMFGVLHSRAHELWARGMGTQLREVESGFRYTPTTTFETFAFPRPGTDQASVIAAAAADLDRLRKGWLDPPGLSDEDLLRRTLTNLYNEPPAWLRQAHKQLDHAVLDAYAFPTDISDDDLLARLLDLNLNRDAV
jgi:type II restriction/modification system DNA methylase subunit YeeA